MAYPQSPPSFSTQKLLSHVREKWGSRPCPMCGQGPWNVQDRIYQLLEFNQGGLMVGGPVVPVVPVTCGNCGNTILVNAIVAKALDPQKPEGHP